MQWSEKEKKMTFEMCIDSEVNQFDREKKDRERTCMCIQYVLLYVARRSPRRGGAITKKATVNYTEVEYFTFLQISGANPITVYTANPITVLCLSFIRILHI